MDVLGSLITGQDAQIQEINQSLKTIEADLKQLQDSKGDVDHDINTLRAQIREQIQAVYDAGYEEWILWNATNRYSPDGLLAAGEEKQ